ncbi:hypothetical protein SAMN05192583_0235 [Sphingomonas gellani]|uniref:Uncharacterized protein n=1 Tax=Sphingomonas gellani TaxID=1166340 RepID=A0A1H7YEX0_9SPHN|nr:hypothetical protein [Sphingomonas gellani]SEM44451.1 hypothetical protein SAMN05192583_0235 [Sphingomonas gellani]
MFTDFRRQFAVLVCTVLMSSACVLSAVGPAQAGASPSVAKAARFVA